MRSHQVKADRYTLRNFGRAHISIFNNINNGTSQFIALRIGCEVANDRNTIFLQFVFDISHFVYLDNSLFSAKKSQGRKFRLEIQIHILKTFIHCKSPNCKSLARIRIGIVMDKQLTMIWNKKMVDRNITGTKCGRPWLRKLPEDILLWKSIVSKSLAFIISQTCTGCSEWCRVWFPFHISKQITINWRCRYFTIVAHDHWQ